MGLFVPVEVQFKAEAEVEVEVEVKVEEVGVEAAGKYTTRNSERGSELAVSIRGRSGMVCMCGRCEQTRHDAQQNCYCYFFLFCLLLGMNE